MNLVVTIDGPAGSGKSTIARALATRLGLPHVDTGAYYRAATLAVLRSGLDLRDPHGCAAVVRASRIRRERGRTLLDGEDVEDDIRGPEVTAAVSAVSAHPEVRRALLDVQQEAIGERGAVVEGRDAGTVVAPDAALKVWLTASVGERARRRAAQLSDTDVTAHERDLLRRDAEDAERLVAAPGAVTVDTTDLAVEQVVDALVEQLRAVRPEALR